MLKKFLSIGFAALLVLSMSSQHIYAEDPTYTVELDGGLHGTATLEAESNEFVYNTELNINQVDDSTYTITKGSEKVYTVKLNDDKYYIKGIHESGKYLENSEVYLLPNLTLDQDTSLVVLYGVKGDQVYYDVEYRLEEETGTELISADRFYCNRGERVVVGAKYIDNYTYKNTKAFAGTISSSGSVKFVFTYTPVTSGTGETTYDEYYVYEEGTIPGGTGGGGGAAPVTPAPAEIIDIDEPEVPQAEPGTEEPENNQGNNGGEEIIEPEPVPTSGFWDTLMHSPLLLGGLTGSLLLLFIFLFFVLKKDRGNE